MELKRLIALDVLGDGADVPVPVAISDLAATANLAGTITVSWTLPSGATGALVRYNVDQAAAPLYRFSGIDLGLTIGTSVTLTGVEYGATYRFSAWAYNAGGYSAAADTASATGPFNPLAYSTHLESWIDARRETAYSTTNPVTTPTQHVSGGPAFTQAGADGLKPTWLEAASGIGGVPAFLFDDAASQMWLGPDTEMHHNTRGMTIAALANVNDTTIATAMYLFTKWQQTGNARTWRLGKGTSDWLMYFDQDGDGSPQGFVSGGGDNTNTHSMVSTWNPGVDARLYDLGVLIDTDTAINYAQLGGASGNASLLRIGCSYASAQELYWSGRCAVLLAYSENLSETAAILLSDHLAALAGA